MLIPTNKSFLNLPYSFALTAPAYVSRSLVLDLSAAPAGLFAHAKADGSDIRVTDEDGAELAREVLFYPAEGKGALFFRPRFGTSFRVHYGHAALREPAATNANGRRRVWDSDDRLVMHMDGFTDSGSYVQAFSSTGVPSPTAGKIGKAIASDGVHALTCTDVAITKLKDFSVSFWVNLASTSEKGMFFTVGSSVQGGWGVGVGSGNCGTNGNDLIGVSWNRGWFPLGSFGGSGWKHVCFVNDNYVWKAYVDGVLLGTTSTMQLLQAVNYTGIGCLLNAGTAGYFFTGPIDEVVARDRVPSADEAAEEFAMGNSPDWWTDIGDEESVSRVVMQGTLRDTASPTVALAENLARDVMFRTKSQFSSDGTDFWKAAEVSYPRCYAADTWFAFRGGASHLFTSAQIANILTKFVAAKNAQGDIPIALNSDGTAYVYYSSWDRSEIHATGDGAFMCPLMAKLHCDKSGDISVFNSVKTSLKTALSRIPRNGTTSLVTVTPGDEWIPYGFHDMVRTTGDNLMGSLLYYEAAQAMAYLCGIAGDAADAALFAAESAAIKAALTAALWSSADGMFWAATIQCKQIDILGSAYAVYLGVASHAQATAIGNYLVTNYDELTSSGYIRQSPEDWAYSYYIPSGPSGMGHLDYQNGYWSVGNEWVIRALYGVDPAKAKEYAEAQVNSLRPLVEYLPGGGAENNLESPFGTLAGVLALPDIFPR